ncbi:YbaK/EbsC family protein [Levilactobacillus yonginensis]|uniref:YbaK/EbsC family protein n=1 Tax=Levilactobacillus yonginensis TaxID=1054041 RepID=UPI000F7BB197|nr:YbaK/EbsC family protein [Levilactobacillus yonginensis]
MSLETVTTFFEQLNLTDRITEFDQSTATVADAAATLGVRPDQIAKTLALKLKEGPIVIVVKGTAKIANPKFKAEFHQKAHMVPFDELEDLIGHPAGGVCPFGLKPGVGVYFDASLKDEDVVYPAAGIPDAVVKLTVDEMEKYAQPLKWIDIVKED